MSTVGQAAGGLVGGIAGFFIGGPSGAIYGAQIGIMAGGYIDPPKGPKGTPPSASDLAVQTASYGVPLGRGYGKYGRYGNVFWVEGNTLVAREREVSGGKGGAPKGTTYDIYGTFAVGFGEGEISAFSKLWFSGKLVYDASASELGAVIATNEAGGSITFYTGSATQLPDPRIQADLGADNTPAWRGMPYIVVKDWPMADYGNTLAGLQVKAELTNGDPEAHSQLLASVVKPPADGNAYELFRLRGDRIVATTLTYLAWNYDLASVHQQQYIFGSDVCVPTSEAVIPLYHDEAFESKVPISIQQSDVDCALFALYRNTPTYIGGHDAGGAVVMNSGPVPSATLPYLGYRAVVDRGDLFLIDTGSNLYKLPFAVQDGTVATVASSASTYTVEYFGASENYVFAVLSSGFSPTSCTVYKFDRTSLALVDTMVQSISGSYAMIHVISDVEFYTMASDGAIWRWLSGVASDTGLRYTGGHNVDNRLLVVSPTLAYVVKHGAPPTIYACWMRTTSDLVPLADILTAECMNTGLLTAGDIDVSEITQMVRGYRIASLASIKSAIEPLQAAWPFDVIPHGYQIKFVPRGQASVATIDVGELGAVAGNETPGVQITASREMASQLPREVFVKYLDVTRDYDISSGPGAKRLNTDAVNVIDLDLGIVLNADESAGIEEVLLYMYWLERTDVSFVLPPPYQYLEAADVVTITAPSATYELRLTEINYLPDGRLECKAKFNNAAVYTPTAVGQESTSPGQTLAFSGPSNFVPLDVPLLVDAMNAPGLLAGVGGYLDGWPGGTLMRSDDAGQTWSSVQGFTPGMVAGLAINAIGAGRSDIIDASSRLNFRLHSGDLASVSLTAMLNGANGFAYGAPGRWEIIGIQNFATESDGSLTGYDLLRGRFGSEWAMETHLPYDELVLLDIGALKFVAMNIASLNQSRLYRAVTNGRTFDSATDEAVTYAGINLKPLAPVYLNGSRHPTTNDWSGTFVRRTRLGGEWVDGTDALLSEASESYEVEIWNSSYTTLKRTLAVTSPAFSYTAAQQFADFTAVQSSLYLKIYQLSATVGRGYPLTGSLTTSMPVYGNAPTAVDYLVVAGGGSGGYSSNGNSYAGGGGGGGGVLTGTGHAVSTGTPITVTVGAGGTGTNSTVNNGQNSVFDSVTAIGGGAGARGAVTSANGNAGGSGGGGSDGGTVGAKTTGQGYDGGFGAVTWGTAGGGGGAGAAGAGDSSGVTGNGGAGISSSIPGSSLNYGGGDGAGKYNNSDTGGTASHGGGAGGNGSTGGGSRTAGAAGSANTGGGGGGAGAGITGTPTAGGSGGSGVVIIRYPDTYDAAIATTGSPTVTVTGGYRIYQWTASGSITF